MPDVAKIKDSLSEEQKNARQFEERSKAQERELAQIPKLKEELLALQSRE